MKLRIAIILIIWGILGGWAMLGQWDPNFNRLTKDQATIAFGFLLAIASHKKTA